MGRKGAQFRTFVYTQKMIGTLHEIIVWALHIIVYISNLSFNYNRLNLNKKISNHLFSKEK